MFLVWPSSLLLYKYYLELDVVSPLQADPESNEEAVEAYFAMIASLEQDHPYNTAAAINHPCR